MKVRLKVLRLIYLGIFLALIVFIFLQHFDWYWRWVYPFRYQELIIKYAKLYGVDPYLVAAIIFVESHFDPEAVSSKGAAGLMQIMPGTGQWIASRMNLQLNSDDLFDPEVNIRLGCWYLNHLFQEFKGDIILVLAAYNGGKGNVRNWLEEGVWEGKRTEIQKIPFPETRKYILDVEAVYKKYQEIYR